MDCPKCSEPVLPEDEFCGNCGQQLTSSPPSESLLAAADQASLPAAAVPLAAPILKTGRPKAIVGLVLSLLAFPGALVPVLGLTLGVAGLVLGTSSRQYYKKSASLLAIVFGAMAILLSLAAWVYLINNHK